MNAQLTDRWKSGKAKDGYMKDNVLHHDSKVYFHLGIIVVIVPCIFTVHHKAGLLSLAWIMNGAAITAICFLFVDGPIIKCSIGKL